MSGTLKVGGVNLATHTGTDGTGNPVLDSGVVFPAGHWLQSQHQEITWEVDVLINNTEELWAQGDLTPTTNRSVLQMTLKKENARVYYWAAPGTVNTGDSQSRWILTVIGREFTTDLPTTIPDQGAYTKTSSKGDGNYTFGQSVLITLGDAMDWGTPSISGVLQLDNDAGEVWAFGPIGWNDQNSNNLSINSYGAYQRGAFMIAEI